MLENFLLENLSRLLEIFNHENHSRNFKLLNVIYYSIFLYLNIFVKKWIDIEIEIEIFD